MVKHRLRYRKDDGDQVPDRFGHSPGAAAQDTLASPTQ